MITRLIEAHWTQTPRPAAEAAVDFWLRELRTPALLVRLAGDSPSAARRLVPQRPLLAAAVTGDEVEVARLLREEEDRERDADRLYWAPRRSRLESLRREFADRRREPS
jgi:hypothetical protein